MALSLCHSCACNCAGFVPYTGRQHLLPMSRLVLLVKVVSLLGLLTAPLPSNGYGVHNEAPLQYEIEEEVQWGTIIGNIFRDANLRRFYNTTVQQKLQFSFLTQGDHATLFSLDERNSDLRTAARVDRDKICPKQAECDIKMDVAVRPVEFFLSVKVVVRIIDLNDNAPRFPQENMASSLSESTALGNLFPVPSASDKDSPRFGVKSYRFETYSKKFKLEIRNTTDGMVDLHLVLLGELDRETEQSYQMRVIATDGENTGSINIDITVVDINDNSPKFLNSSYEVEVAENTPSDATIVQVYAEDADAGSNGEIQYDFTSRTSRAHGDTFGINPHSGHIYLKKALDFERQEQYSLSVTAQDQGTDSLPTPTKVVVHVIDINDHVPQITINALTGSGHAQIPEHSEVPYFIAHISVYDPDGGNNGKFNCSLDDPLFRLVQLYDTEFKVMAVAELDREMQDLHDVRIICRDQGVPAQVAISHLPVHVQDVNDNTPKFALDMYYATVEENNPPNTYILQVSAKDRDAGMNKEIEFELEVNARNAFQIDPYTGVLRTNMEFDRELIQDLEFQVFAVDKGNPRRTGSTTILITISDQDDEAPRFTEDKFTFHIDENSPDVSEVGRVTAADADLPTKNEFTYHLDESDPLTDLFTIDSISGLVKTRRSLDREAREMYLLNVYVRSKNPSHPSDSASIIIYVDDVNDNAPIIDFPTEENRTIHVSNQVPMGYTVARILAHDMDIDRNSRMTYFISEGNEANEFVIGPKTGDLFVNEKFNKYDYQTYKLVVMVKDHGVPQRISVATLIVIVNSSIPYVPPPYGGSHSAGGQGISDLHLIIIICVVLGSAIVATLLVVAIVLLKRRDQKHRPDPKYAPKTEVKFTIPSDDPKTDTIRSQTQLPNGSEGDSLVRTSPQGSDGDPLKMKPGEPEEDDVSMSNVHVDQGKGPQEVHSPCNDKDTDSGCCADMSNHEHCGEDAEGNRLANQLQAQGVPGSILKLKCYHPAGHRRPPPRQSSFTDWLNSESQNLKQSGHVYRVNDLNRASAPPPHLQPNPSHLSPQQANIAEPDNRKVRFTEGQQEALERAQSPLQQMQHQNQDVNLDSFKNPRKVQMNSFQGTYGGHRNYGASIGPDTIPEEPELHVDTSHPHMTIGSSWDEGSVV